MTMTPMRRLALILLLAAGPCLSPAWAGEDGGSAEGRAELERATAELKRAQAELQRAAEEMARAVREAHAGSPGAYAFEFISNPDRAMLGVMIDDDNGEQNRGVPIIGVTPGSGADKAGLKSGDLLLKANGQSLASDKDEVGPAHKLHDIMSALKPGDTVAVEYERNRQRHTAKVVATRPAQAFAPQAPVANWHCEKDCDFLIAPEAPVPPQAPLPPEPRLGVLGDLQLARLSRDLQPYFKTDAGVLVVSAPRNSNLGLKDGDVIRSINDRAVKDPISAWNALSDIGGNSTVHLEVVRAGQTISVEGAMPPQVPARIVQPRKP
jgi:S1-C subfamily serine protease